MLWLPVGWTAGYLVLLVFVAAPLRRSGAYTLPDFAQLRLESVVARRASSLLVVAIGLLYLIPQFQGAGPDPAHPDRRAVVGRAAGRRGRRVPQRPARRHAERHPRAGLPLLAQAAGPADAALLPRSARSADAERGPERRRRRRRRLGRAAAAATTPLYLTYSLVLATFFGTMGLPHVVVRFYTNPDGRAARRTTLVGARPALAASTCCPSLYGVLGRVRRLRTSSRRAAPTRSCSSCRAGSSTGRSPRASRRCSPPAPSRRSCRPRPGSSSRSPAC